MGCRETCYNFGPSTPLLTGFSVPFIARLPTTQYILHHKQLNDLSSSSPPPSLFHRSTPIVGFVASTSPIVFTPKTNFRQNSNFISPSRIRRSLESAGNVRSRSLVKTFDIQKPLVASSIFFIANLSDSSSPSSSFLISIIIPHRPHSSQLGEKSELRTSNGTHRYSWERRFQSLRIFGEG